MASQPATAKGYCGKPTRVSAEIRAGSRFRSHRRPTAEVPSQAGIFAWCARTIENERSGGFEQSHSPQLTGIEVWQVKPRY